MLFDIVCFISWIDVLFTKLHEQFEGEIPAHTCVLGLLERSNPRKTDRRHFLSMRGLIIDLKEKTTFCGYFAFYSYLILKLGFKLCVNTLIYFKSLCFRDLRGEKTRSAFTSFFHVFHFKAFLASL